MLSGYASCAEYLISYTLVISVLDFFYFVRYSEKTHSDRDAQHQITIKSQFDGLVQERRNSIANALDLLLICTNPSI